MKLPFDNRLIGHHSTRDQLLSRRQSGKLPHAMLFAGPEGIGKRLAAWVLAGELLSINNAHAGRDPSDDPHLFEVGNHPDFHYLSRDPERKEISVEQVRELCKRLRLSPFHGKRAVAIIDDAHELSSAAANALLTTLEEPPHDRFLILVSHAPHRLLGTVTSRCQRFDFSGLDDEETLLVLESIAKALDDKKLFVPEELRARCGNSLALLQLASFVQPRTMMLVQNAELKEHIRGMNLRLQMIERALEVLLEPRTDALGPAIAASLASDLGAAPQNLRLLWPLLFRATREKLRLAPAEQMSAWSEILRGGLKTQNDIELGNANAVLHLTALFTRYSTATFFVATIQ